MKAVQQLLRLYKVDHRYVMVPLSGGQLIRSGIDHQLAELQRLAPNVRALIDSERSAQDAPLENQRQAFCELCSRLKLPCTVLERRAIENYFPQEAIQRALGSEYSALANFESLKERRGNGWPKSQNWRIAREMTRDHLTDTDLGRFFETL